MAMLPNPNMARGSSWGGFGYKPQQRQPQMQAGMGGYANAGNTPPSAFGGAQPMQPGVMQGMGQRTLTPEMAAQYKPQMMASALMNPQQGGTFGGAPAAPPGGFAKMEGNETPEQMRANNAAVYGQQPGASTGGNVSGYPGMPSYNPAAAPMPGSIGAQLATGQPMPQSTLQGTAQPPQNPGAGLLGNVAPNMAQAAAQQGQAVPAHQMARPMPPPTGYAR